MVIYIAAFAAALATGVLAVIWLGDLYEREPLDLIQNTFLAGLVVQLALVLALGPLLGLRSWSGPPVLATLVAMTLFLPGYLRRTGELDERYDGVVYAVAWACGAACVSHLYDLPTAVATSPHTEVFAGSAAPDLRDLLVVLSGPGPRADLADQLVLVLMAAVVGAALGVVRHQGHGVAFTTWMCTGVGLLLGAAHMVLPSPWMLSFLVPGTVILAVALKRTSRFRGADQPDEAQVLVRALKTILVVFGAVTLALALLMALSVPWNGSGPSAPGSPELEPPVVEG